MAADTTVLTMHQPWASLLVYGLKRIEGRTWDSAHRGRLWIHAAAKEMDPADLQELQAYYTQVHALDGNTPQFPPAYPTSALLGCVDVVDVLPQAAVEHWPGLPDSCRMEATSPFCFLCENPKRLVVPQPLKGEHKLWQLPKAMLKVALQGLREPPGLAPFTWRAFGDPRAMLSPAPNTCGPEGGSRAKGGASNAHGAAVATAKAAGSDLERPSGSGAGQEKSAARVQATSLAGDVEAPPTAEVLEKRIRAVRKKLRQVADLQAAVGSAAAGQAGLTAEQRDKLTRVAEWEAELAALEQQLATVTGMGR
ncbi:hypothetical protein HYH02_003620 [Chlamydomonas schloesseri]|uniref:ASCH domain-containing protein n=1 Tax=Chlamydomonas schloesseri TaxID=2026947 RepID=A0A835WPU6_9CHLO|nr:hypothetical protein HYH02_003620 [Chlamydomonas schloesseri]|eukprot:KAG2451844.1 hypothetical protein HYH02_003620 [Chlamydomonas schloesseri]